MVTVDAQHLEELVGGAVAVAVGTMIAAVPPERLPEPLRGLVVRLGRFRHVVGVAIALAAVLLVFVD
jgi:hypothetical protein